MVPWFFRLIPVLIAAFDGVSLSVAQQELSFVALCRVYVAQIDSFAQFPITIEIPIYLPGDLKQHSQELFTGPTAPDYLSPSFAASRLINPPFISEPFPSLIYWCFWLLFWRIFPATCVLAHNRCFPQLRPCHINLGPTNSYKHLLYYYTIIIY